MCNTIVISSLYSCNIIRSVGRYHRASTPHTAYITHTLLDLFRVREQESQNRKRVRTDAVAVLPQPAQAATLGPIQTLTCLLLAGAGEPHRIAIEQKGSCQQHRVRVLHRVASEERGLPNATAGGHLAASLQRAHVGMLRAHLADPSEQRSCRRRPSKLLWPTVLSPARAHAYQPARSGLCTVAPVSELVAPSVVIFAAATL